MRHLRLLSIASLATAAIAAPVLSVDSRRGESLFETQGCIECHSIAGKGGKVGPDLGKRIDRNYTPAQLASVMWNHAPTMWTAIGKRGMTAPPLDEQAAADLFAYFYSVRFFDKPGDAARGKRLFAAKHCAECHGIVEPNASGAKPVAQWESLGHPILLAGAMWNHAANMRQAFAARKFAWPQVSGQDLADLLVYLRNLPSTNQLSARFDSSGGENGAALFQSKGCAGCHKGKLDLAPRLRGQTLTDIAADMWSHAPKMAQPPPSLEPGEMRQIVIYLWSRQVFEEDGNPADGKKVFTAKRCAVCHNDPASGAPSLADRKGGFSSISMMSTLWRHGPRMLEQMRTKNLPWPTFSSSQMSNLIAYLNSGK